MSNTNSRSGDGCDPLNRDVEFMRLALEQARYAAERNEVPVGALIVRNDQVVGAGFNVREQAQNPLGHAELIAIAQAAKTTGQWRLAECVLYVTLEPCIMCVGAILQARIRRLVFASLDAKAGAVESLYRLCDDSRLNHRLPAVGGVLAAESANLLSEFFSELRKKKQQLTHAERWPSSVEGA